MRFKALCSICCETAKYIPIPLAWKVIIAFPWVAGAKSYSFRLGQFAEFGNCQTHGDYIRAISAEALEMVVSWCKISQPINWVRSVHLTYGMPEDEEAYKRQPGEVYIYNPENLPLPRILTAQRKAGEASYSGVTCDMIETQGMSIQIPYYYSIKEGIVPLFCTKCPSPLDSLSVEGIAPDVSEAANGARDGTTDDGKV
jgi:hypothetical protein